MSDGDDTKQKRGYYRNDEFDVETVEKDSYRDRLLKDWDKSKETTNQLNSQKPLEKAKKSFGLSRIKRVKKNAQPAKRTFNRLKVPSLKADRKLVVVSLLSIVAVLGVVGLFKNSDKTSDENTATTNEVLGLSDEQIASLIDGQDVPSTTGQTTNNPPGLLENGNSVPTQTVGLASVVRDINGVEVVVIFMPAPNEFDEDSTSLKNLALSLDNKISIDQLETNKGTVYIVARENQTYTALFFYADYLYFMTTKSKILNQTWTDYINNL